MRLPAFLGQDVVHVGTLRQDCRFPGFDKKVRVSCSRDHVSNDRQGTSGTIAWWRGWYDIYKLRIFDIVLSTKLLKLFFYTDATLKHWVKKYGWKEENKSIIFVANQDENIKTKNITEKIDFENVAGLMAACL